MMADFGRRPAVSNLSHSSVSIQLVMDCFPVAELAQPNMSSDISKEMSHGKTILLNLAFNVSLKVFFPFREAQVATVLAEWISCRKES